MSITVEDVAGTTYVLQASDDGKAKRFTSNSPVSITCPDTITEGFECVVIQAGDGQLTLNTSGTAVFINTSGVSSRAKGAYMAVTAEQDAVFKVNGELSVSITLVKHNFNSASDPTTSNDDTEGYSTLSMWINTTSGRVFDCYDNSTGTAVWVERARAGKKNVTDVNAATYDVITSDEILHVTYTATAAVTSLTLMSDQAVEGRTVVIKDAGGNASVNNITIDTEGAETIDGAGTLVLSANYQSVTLYCDGTNWFII